MVHFQNISLDVFLSDYWQKKPLVIRNALPCFINPLTPNELAGLSLEEDVESRIVLETPGAAPAWHLKRGPFLESDFSHLPQTNWTLLVQGVDRLIPEVYALLDHFDFIPQWRIDDVMISYACQNGSVGPHYDNYDVFLYQALGRRKWSLTSKKCTPQNYIKDLELRIMNEFEIEEDFILEEGDMLYLPPHIGHYGVSQSDDCMTYSFGYRSYQGQELWDSLGDFISEKGYFKKLYQDPNWSELNNTAELFPASWQQAQKLLIDFVNDEQVMKDWFGCFATRLDQSSEQQLPLPVEDHESVTVDEFLCDLKDGIILERHASCRFAYVEHERGYKLYINGCEWGIDGVSPSLIALVANHRYLNIHEVSDFFKNDRDLLFLFDLWKLQWLQVN